MRGTERSARGLGVILCLCLAVAACRGTERGSTDGWRAVVDTVGDTIVVHTVSGSVWGDPATLEAEVSIGRFEGPDAYILGDPGALGVAPDGSIVVLDTQVPVIRVYAADGSWVRDIGRQGRGPGEYDGPDAIAVLHDGRVIVRDPGNARISVFALDGTLLDTWPHAAGFNTGRRYYVDAAGNSYTTILLERGLPPWEWKFGLVRYDPSGQPTDTLAAPVWAYEPAQVKASREQSSSVRSVPFTPQRSWTFSPLGYFVGGLSDAYRIDLFRSDGSVLRLERDRAPVAVSRAEADEARRRITEGLKRQYGAWRWNGPPVPDTKPPFREIFTSDEGNVWVVLSTPGVATLTDAEAAAEYQASGRTPARFVEPVAFDVFAPDGRYLGAVRTPASFAIDPEPVVRGDTVWAVTRDDLGVATITRFRIVHAAPGAAQSSEGGTVVRP